VCLVAPHWGERVSSWPDSHQVLEVWTKRASRSKVRDDTSLDRKRCWLLSAMVGIELDQDVVEFDVSMCDSMSLEMKQRRSNLRHDHCHQSVRNDLRRGILQLQEVLQRDVESLENEELGLAISHRSVLQVNERFLACKIGEMHTNRVVDLGKELAHELQNMWMVCDGGVLAILVHECSLSTSRAQSKVEAHFQRVSFGGLWMLRFDASNIHGHSIVSTAKNHRDLE